MCRLPEPDPKSNEADAGEADVRQQDAEASCATGSTRRTVYVARWEASPRFRCSCGA